MKASTTSASHTMLEAITSLPHLALYNGLAGLAERMKKEHGITLVTPCNGARRWLVVGGWSI
eukprot:14941912-Heterocapsa_arctica.AAC.1